ncbi:hypothetical protein ACEUZ9_002835 [Paracoccus litorisediminis]|uniref:hypothetical protein n=1 Tax=Paracoccus litorisediminis TaxID=2006130 RepID=UPI00372FE119
MKVDLYYKEVTLNGVTAVVPYLWDASKGSAPDQILERADDFSMIVKEVLGGSGRRSEINLVSSRDAARALAALHQIDTGAISVVSKIGEDWCVGTVHFDGTYEHDLPAICDLRSHGEALEFRPALEIYLVSVPDPGFLELDAEQLDFGM